MCAATSLGQLTYASFYLPTLGFGALATTPDNPVIQYLPQIPFLGPQIGPSILFYALAGLSFLGAMQAHGIARSIYGPDGPISRPKHKTLQVQHSLAIILKKDADEIPLVPCRIAHQGFTLIFLDYLQYRCLKFLYPKSAAPEDRRRFEKRFGPVPPRHQLEIGFHQLAAESKSWSWRAYPRFVYFVPMGLIKHLSWLSLILLVGLGILSTVSYTVFLLVLAHAVLLFRGRVWKSFPDYIHPDAIDDRFIAEYERYQDETDELRPRIVTASE